MLDVGRLLFFFFLSLQSTAHGLRSICKVAGDVAETQVALVLCRQQRFRCRPENVQIRVVPDDPFFALRMVIVRAIVKKFGFIAEHAKTVGESDRHVKLFFITGGQDLADPASEGRRAEPDVYNNVKNFAAEHADQLALRMPDLVMESAQSMPDGLGMVNLDKISVNALRRESIPPVGFHEKSAAVLEDLGLDKQNVPNGCRCKFHAL